MISQGSLNAVKEYCNRRIDAIRKTLKQRDSYNSMKIHAKEAPYHTE